MISGTYDTKEDRWKDRREKTANTPIHTWQKLVKWHM